MAEHRQVASDDDAPNERRKLLIAPGFYAENNDTFGGQRLRPGLAQRAEPHDSATDGARRDRRPERQVRGPLGLLRDELHELGDLEEDRCAHLRLDEDGHGVAVDFQRSPQGRHVGVGALELLREGEADAQRAVRSRCEAQEHEGSLRGVSGVLRGRRGLAGDRRTLLRRDAGELGLPQRHRQDAEQPLPPVAGTLSVLELVCELAEQDEGVLLELEVHQQIGLFTLRAGSHQSSQLRQRVHLARGVPAALLQMHELVDGPPNGGVRSRQLLSLLVQASCVEELLQLLVEDLKLSHEGFRVAVRLPALLDQVVARDHVAWVCAPMQLVLQIVLDIILQILGDVVTVGDVPDARHGYRNGELVGKGRERRKDAARDEALGIPARGKLPQQSRDLARGVCMGTGPVVPTILLALDLATGHPSQVGLQARELVQRADFAAFQEGARQVQLVAPTLPLRILLGNALRDGAPWANTFRWEKCCRRPCRLRSRRRSVRRG
mmetsp:Transcript_98095/g.256138  ORF Transcript_98095/g.256138 Transcript_98095/m.256138 type:complete len:494 (-) Transcript_98095:455-1936(-)